MVNRDMNPTDDGTIDLCIAAPRFYPVLVGPGERFRRYAPGLKARGVNLRVFTIQYPGMSSFDVVDGITIQRIPVDATSKWHDLVFLGRVLQEFRHPERRPDVLQFFSRTYWVIPTIRAFRLLRVPKMMVFTMLGKNRGSPLRKRLRNTARRMVFDSYDCVVTSSGVMTEQLRTLGVSSTRLETIPNGVNVQRFRPARSCEERRALRNELGFSAEDPMVLFIGSIFPRKGVDVLLAGWQHVARRHPNAQLVLVGSRHEDQSKYQPFRDKVDRLVAASPAPERITFTGVVSNVEEYLRAADLFVFPSHREGMPNVVPEAMATGLPCIVTPFQGLPDEFGMAGRDYHLVPRTPDAMAEAMSRLLSDHEERRTLGRCARNWIEEHMDVEDSLDTYARVYRQLAQTGA